ncbi:MAG: histidine kinase [Candidatus Azobacteroides sp.]|nr:histidine kinase [Candidatus Azobacteroides sp.]
MIKSRKIRYFEIALYIFIGLIAVGVPLFMHIGDEEEWKFIFREWTRLLPLLLIFLVNNFLLAPYLLLRSKYIPYIVLSLVLLIVVASFGNSFRYSLFKPEKFEPKQEMINEHKKPAFLPENNRDRSIQGSKEKKMEPSHKPEINRPFHKGPFPPSPSFFNYGTFLIGFLIVGFNSGVKIFIQWMDEKEVREEKERQYLSTELAFLKHQVSPHFFMNTLNNIHALIDINSERAKDAVIKLSRLMRYLLHESNTEKVPLKKELDFLESYVELMRLRYNETNLSIRISYPEKEKEVKVPALLFLPLIENAFKHGVLPNKKSFVDIDFSIADESLVLKVKNSNFPAVYPEINETSGIGLENIRKRLDLMYKNNYTFTITSTEQLYEVTISIPLA